MSDLAGKIWTTAQGLMTAAGMSAAVATTDINRQAQALHRQFAEHSLIEIKKRISDEIKKNHRPGVSGSL